MLMAPPMVLTVEAWMSQSQLMVMLAQPMVMAGGIQTSPAWCTCGLTWSWTPPSEDLETKIC